MGRAAGELRLVVDHRDGRSYAREQYHRGALRVLRPHYLDRTGQVSYTVVNPGGAYLGADRYEVDLTAAEDASLLLTTQSATKVYRTPQGAASQDMVIRLGAGAVLESLPDQLIVYREGSYRQSTRVTMHPSASLLLAEVVTPGWSPSGTAFGWHALRLDTEVLVTRPEGEPEVFVVDRMRIVPDGGTTGLGVMEGHSHTGQLLVVDPRVDDALVDEVAALVDHAPVRGAVTRVGRPLSGVDPRPSGFAVRALGEGTEPLTALNHAVADLLRSRWRGQGAVRLRKY